MASNAGIKKPRSRPKPKATSSTSPAAVETIDSAFPISAAEQGSDITTVNVGTGSRSQIFKIHKNLLCSASKCFDGALNDGFKESDGDLNLEHDHPVVFEVLYQWLYSGLIRDASFGKLTKARQYHPPTFYISPVLLWLRVYKFADCRLIPSLQAAAYRRFCACFKISTLGHLTSQLVDELYDDTGSEHLQRYLVHHVAYHMGRPMTTGTGTDQQVNWKVVLDGNAEFKAAVGERVVDARLAGEFGHPSGLEEFKGFKAGLGLDLKEEVPAEAEDS